MLYFEPGGVPYMDGKIYESSFTRTWNHAIWTTEEEFMVETMTEGQSGRKKPRNLRGVAGLDQSKEATTELVNKGTHRLLLGV